MLSVFLYLYWWVDGPNFPEEMFSGICNAKLILYGFVPRMREVEIGEGKALLVKEKGQFHAVGAKCTHYGAPLVKGNV